MPLLDGQGEDVIAHNIAELIAAGHPRDQAVAIAYDHARRQYRSDAFDSGHAQAVVHMVAIAHTHGTANRRRRMPKQNYPRALEAEYADKIVELVRRARRAYDPLLAEMPRMLARARAERGDAERMDAEETEFARRIAAAADQMRREMSDAQIQQLATFFARKTSQAQRRELARQLSASLGVEVLPDERYVPAMLDYFTHENATLIGSIPEELHQQVANLTARAFTKRMHPDTFAAELEQRFKVAEGRARFIARDQLGKLWGQLNAVRQRGVGITKFTWRSQEDSLVRPSHKHVANRVWSYDDPPAVGRNGERMLPGEDFGCRCGADPIVDEILAAAADLRARMRPAG